MLLTHCSNSIITLSSFKFSVRTFIKHLPSIQKIRYSTAILSSKSTLFETLNPNQKQQVHAYVDTLLQWNQKMNLTAVKDASEVMERHVEDSLAIISPIKSSYVAHCKASCENISVVDVGSGAGLPGLILAIACPGWKVVLLESMNKRCVFLEHAIGVTRLSNVQVVRDRAEARYHDFGISQNFGQNLAFREGFDVVVARAVAELRTLAEYCLPLVRVGGLFLAAKGHDPLEEVNRAERAIHLMGASISQLCSVESNGPYGQRTAVICLKNNPTPRRYPREPGTPAKSPL